MSGSHDSNRFDERRQGGRRANDVSIKQLQELQDRVVTHIKETEGQLERGDSQFQEILARLSKIDTAIKTVEISTQGIVQLHKDIQAAARLGKGLQNFLIWCIKWGGIWAAIAIAINWVVNNAPRPPTDSP